MTPARIIKQGDTFPPLALTLFDTNGPIPLTGASSVTITMLGQAKAQLVTGVCTITNATQGQVQYAWGSNDTSIPDTYDVEFTIHWTAGGTQTVPNAEDENQTIEVDPKL